MQTNWTTEDAQAIAALVDAARRALATLRWVERCESGREPAGTMGIDLPIIRAEILALEEAIAAVRRRKLAP
jgi:hypothetical protein